jgi:Flagellar hook-length control protein FliK
MKVPEQKPNGPKVDAPTSKQKGPASFKQKLFADKMHKKSAARQIAPLSLQFARRDLPVMPQQPLQQNAPPISQTSGTDLPVPIQNLVHEIQVHVDPRGGAEVRIQFDSEVLDGLRVNIRKGEEGEIGITFLAQNETTTQLLSKHIPTLSHALASRGVPVASIRLDTNEKFTSSEQLEIKRFDSRGRKQNVGGQRKRR